MISQSERVGGGGVARRGEEELQSRLSGNGELVTAVGQQQLHLNSIKLETNRDMHLLHSV